MPLCFACLHVSSLFFSLFLLSSLFFSLLLSSLSFLLSSSFFFLFLSSFFFLPSVIMGHTQRRNSNTCQEPGPTDMSDGMRSTNICQKPFILSCFVLSSLSSSSVFFLCLLSLSSFSVSVSVCGVVCAVWCGTLKNPVCRFKTPRCVHSQTSPCMPATRAHAFTHGGHRQFCLQRTAHVGLSFCPTSSPKVTTGCCPF